MTATSLWNALVLKIEAGGLGTGNALIRFWRATCTHPVFGTQLEYEITAPLGGGMVRFSEDFACGFFPDRFIEFAFVVRDNGTSEWWRDGVRKLTQLADFGSGDVRLVLTSQGTETSQPPGAGITFDSVLIQK